MITANSGHSIPRSRIGLFGGTFNPVHNGHVGVIGEIKTKFDLNTVYIIPAAKPPHKRAKKVADAADRLEMARRAFEALDGYVVSDVEISRSGPSYSIDTVKYFLSKQPENKNVFWILGLDAFLEIETWKAYKALLESVSLIVMSRPDNAHHAIPDAGDIFDVKATLDLPGMQNRFEAHLHNRISTRYRYAADADPDTGCYRHPENPPIFFTAVSPLDISATDIRECIRDGRPIHGKVPTAVENYIIERGLYK